MTRLHQLPLCPEKYRKVPEGDWVSKRLSGAWYQRLLWQDPLHRRMLSDPKSQITFYRDGGSCFFLSPSQPPCHSYLFDPSKIHRRIHRAPAPVFQMRNRYVLHNVCTTPSFRPRHHHSRRHLAGHPSYPSPLISSAVREELRMARCRVCTIPRRSQALSWARAILKPMKVQARR